MAGRSPFNVDTDFAGVSIPVYVPFMWTANPSVPAKDLRELGQLLRAQKQLAYNYGSTGPGSVMHVQGEAFKRGAAPLEQGLLARPIQIGGDQLSTSLAEIHAGTPRSQSA